ncbi:hypothetical protein IF2G_06586 [Cordyceps javanica]|nr:hypothetical protein IF2G_06586 [Cordyceps javanica]
MGRWPYLGSCSAIFPGLAQWRWRCRHGLSSPNLGWGGGVSTRNMFFGMTTAGVGWKGVLTKDHVCLRRGRLDCVAGVQVRNERHDGRVLGGDLGGARFAAHERDRLGGEARVGEPVQDLAADEARSAGAAGDELVLGVLVAWLEGLGALFLHEDATHWYACFARNKWMRCTGGKKKTKVLERKKECDSSD